MRTTRSDLDRVQSESRIEPGKRGRLEALVSSLTIQLARGCKRWHAQAQGRRYGARRSPLFEYMCLPPSISQTYNKLCAPFENKMREIYFHKEVYFLRSLKFVHYLWLCSGLGLREVPNSKYLVKCWYAVK